MFERAKEIRQETLKKEPTPEELDDYFQAVATKVEEIKHQEEEVEKRRRKAIDSSPNHDAVYNYASDAVEKAAALKKELWELGKDK